MFTNPRSRQFAEMAQRSLAGGVASSMRLGADPMLFMERAQGCHIVDVDEHEYIDYMMGAGPLILGHSPQPVIDAVKAQLDQGMLFAWDCALSIEVSARLAELIPCADLVRLTNTGSEAAQLALRLARAYTGRNKIIRFEGHFHGWYDNIYIPTAPSVESLGPRQANPATPASAGQGNALDDVLVLPWNDLAVFARAVAEHRDELAGVIMVPIMFGPGAGAFPREGYLEGVRDICTRNGIVLIFDEVITGFRVALGGAQELFGVQPDVAIYAKAIAAGIPLGAVGGRKEIMSMVSRGEVLHAGTYNGNPIALAAAKATLQELTRDDARVYRYMDALRRRLADGMAQAASARSIPLALRGAGAAMQFFFTENPGFYDYRSSRAGYNAARQSKFEREMLERGAMLRGLAFLSAAHTERDIDATLKIAGEAMQVL